MKNRKDDLLSLAFGELSADAARAVEAQVSGDAEARQELQAFRDLRQSLQHLPPPPPDNLSAERLRAAILDRELKTRRSPAFAWAQWTFAPAALAVIAAVVFVSRPTVHAEPQVVAMSDAFLDSEAKNESLDDLPLFRSSIDFSEPAPAVGMAKQIAKDEPKQAPIRRRIASSARRTRPEAQSSQATAIDHDLEPKKLMAMVQPQQERREAPQTIAAPASDIVEGNPGGDFHRPAPSDTVVLVSSKRDLATGAPAATETEASNVLVGG